MREREPHNWSLPLPWQPLGVTVRVHVLFPCVAVGVLLWVATSRQFEPLLWVQACFVLTMLLFCVVLHELAHVFAARRLEGDAEEVLIWPLGGLAFVDVPERPWSWFWAAAAGPVVNLALSAAAAGGLVALGYVPPLNPLASPLNPRMYNWREGKLYFSIANPGEAELHYYDDEETHRPQLVKLTFFRNEDGHRVLKDSAPVPVEAASQDPPRWKVATRRWPLEPARIGNWHLLLAQFFAVNWFLFWINLLPAFPLDGGRMLQAWLWRRGDMRQATATAAYVGFLIMLVAGVYAIATNNILPAGLAAVIYLCCRHELLMLERTEEEPPQSGYDFTEGYTSLEREQPPPPPPPKQTWLQRLTQQRAEKRRLREQQRREAEERRLDELLDKILRHGRQSLSAEELRFLTRVSGRYPNRK